MSVSVLNGNTAALRVMMPRRRHYCRQVNKMPLVAMTLCIYKGSYSLRSLSLLKSHQLFVLATSTARHEGARNDSIITHCMGQDGDRILCHKRDIADVERTAYE